MNVSDIIANLRKDNNLTLEELEEISNINKSVLSRIENGTRPIRGEELKLLANLFNVSTDYLVGNDKLMRPVDDEEKELLKNFRSLTGEGRNALKVVLDSLKISHSAVGAWKYEHKYERKRKSRFNLVDSR